MQLKIDTIHSSVIKFTNKFKDDEFSLVYPDEAKSMVGTFSNLDDSFNHAGYFLFFTAEQDISLKKLTDYSLKYTKYYKTSNLKRAIIKYNSLESNTSTIKKGTTLYIPDSLPTLITDIRNKTKPSLPFVRGLYFTGYAAGQNNFFNKIKSFKKSGINAVVFDVKDIPGIVSYESRVKEVIKYNTHKNHSIDDIEKMIRTLKNENIYVIARIACFRDDLMIKKNPSLSIQSRSTGGVWNLGKGEIWLDPTNKEAQDYNIKLAVELAEYGVDEIQFDYIRFPTVGDVSDRIYKYSFGKMKTEEAIEHFLKRASEAIHQHKSNVSIDIFGVVAWGAEIDIRKTGQQINRLSKYCDVISPMLYPSHFNDGFDGFSKPGDEPYYFIAAGNKKVRSLSGKNKILIRPWLQAFGWRVSNYNEDYIIKQVKASKDTVKGGYLFWNAKNEYETVLKALSSLKPNER